MTNLYVAVMEDKTGASYSFIFPIEDGGSPDDVACCIADEKGLGLIDLVEASEYDFGDVMELCTC